MKKRTYLIGGLIVGVFGAATSSAFADQVKFSVGKKVVAEYNGAINGRAVSAEGADLPPDFRWFRQRRC